MTRNAFDKTPRRFLATSVTVLACAALLAACSAKEERVQDDFNFDGSCVNCHKGLSAGQVHPTFKLRCVDCHGGNDQVDVPANAFENEADYRNKDFIAQSHDLYPADARTLFKDPKLARFFFANGVDDDGDGVIDEPIQFDDLLVPTAVVDFGEIAELGLQGEGVGQFLDTEYNRDLNYTRWINPGDLRVATMTCGSSSRVAGETGSGCHQSVVDSMRRSIMTNQAAVINGAYYGNQSWRDTFKLERDDLGAAADPRAGAFGYPLDYAATDKCIVTPDNAKEPGGRAQPLFDSACLELIAAINDLNAQAGQPGNLGLPAFESVQGAIVGSVPGTEPGSTLAREGVFTGSSRFEGWGGKKVRNEEAILPELAPTPDENLAGVPDPVDNVLRGFRAYYPLNYPGSTINQNFTFGESIKPNVDNIKTNNPFGRGHSAGCTGCHMAYNYDGSRDAQEVQVVDEDGNSRLEPAEDPTTKHREFNPAQDVVNVMGQDRLIGITLNAKDRDVDKDGVIEDGRTPDAMGIIPPANGVDREQQRFYSANHQLTSRITTQQCGLCHAFVTRIDLAYQGMSEDEQRDALARIAPIEFTTPKQTKVNILSSLVFEEFIGGVFQQLVKRAEVDAIVAGAKQRDEELAAQGLIAGNGGCALETFTEDCNNNGELDTALSLQRVDENGNTVGAPVVINEDINGNGELDLIDHAPRELSVDGRQMRYVYGGANGATRLMDIHFERGMHCIDCHMLQDAHGDGNIYSTNWDQIEVECEDCHGTVEKSATLITSGPNGGNDLTLAKDHDTRPFFERRGGRIIQRSRVTPGLAWEIPQVKDVIDPGNKFFNPEAVEAHSENHLPTATQGTSLFEGAPGQSPILDAKLECYSCHMSWVINCMGCHYAENRTANNRKAVNAENGGPLVDVPGENEVWYNNKNQGGLTNFQLLTFMRSPFVLGVNSTSDEQRVGTFRSSMELYVSITQATGNSLFDNVTFTTYQAIDGNSKRANVATSGAALNQTMPHTVRPFETRGCEQCHSLVDKDRAVRNDHIVSETYGIGAGRYPYVGDWAFLVGNGGLELFEHKAENELIINNRFPGIIVNPNDRVNAPVQALGSQATDVVLVRNFNREPNQAGATEIPTLVDLAVVSSNVGGVGQLELVDVTARGRQGAPTLPRVQTLALAAGPANALVHLAPDVSDPFVYVAQGTAGLTTVKLDATGNVVAPPVNFNATAVNTVAVAGKTLTELVLAGDILYAGTAEGTIEIFSLANPAQPVVVGNSISLGTGPVNGLAIGGFFLYAATTSGLAILQLTNDTNVIALETPKVPNGAAAALLVPGIDASELSYSGGHVYLAAGAAGVIDIDVTTPAKPQNKGDLVAILAPGQTVDAADVVVSKVPGQTWLLVAETNGNMVGLKLDNTQSIRELCLPDPTARNCGLDMDFRDPTIMGRDPSFIPGMGFNALDPSGPPFFRQISIDANVVSGRRLARPALWEKINTQTGRRYRDSFMPGSGTLSLQVMQKMYGVLICEDPATPDVNGNGLGGLGYADDNFFATGTCVPFAPAAAEQAARLQASTFETSSEDSEAGSEDMCLAEEADASLIRLGQR